MDIEIPDWLGWMLLGAIALGIVLATAAGAFSGCSPRCSYGYEYIPEMRACLPRGA